MTNQCSNPAAAKRGAGILPASHESFIKPRAGCPRHGGTRHGAFTLVEMLAVLLIVAIAFALVVGVGATMQEDARADETRHTQAVLLAAFAAYHDAQGAYPPNEAQPLPANGTIGLLRALRAEPTCRPFLRQLALQAIRQNDRGEEFFLDGFGNAMQYFPAGGLGGKTPLLLSTGPDPDDATDDIGSE